MKYEPISEIKKDNEIIDHCFQYIGDIEAKKIFKEFKKIPHDKVEYSHTLRELILGAYLSKIGFCVHYKHKFDSKEPDWCILDKNLSPQCIIELFTFNPDAYTSTHLTDQVKAQKTAWTYFVKPNTDRLYNRIECKALTYKTIVNQYSLPYIISVFSNP